MFSIFYFDLNIKHSIYSSKSNPILPNHLSNISDFSELTSHLCVTAFIPKYVFRFHNHMPISQYDKEELAEAILQNPIQYAFLAERELLKNLWLLLT